MTSTEYITVRDLYAYAKENRLLDARIRICDGMAVSYYPDPRAIRRGRYEIVIDVSANQPVEYDELDAWAMLQDDHERQIDEICPVKNRCRSADELPWEIYGYGPKRRRR